MFLKKTPLIMALILFMSGVNLLASAFDATLPGYVLPNPKGGHLFRELLHLVLVLLWLLAV